jgi:YHS domain-containing protein
MTRKIPCDGCGLEILEEKAIALEWGDDTLYFCSKECEQKQKVPEEIEIDQDDDRGA